MDYNIFRELNNPYGVSEIGLFLFFIIYFNSY